LKNVLGGRLKGRLTLGWGYVIKIDTKETGWDGC
jgi:hypothetical protein